MIRPAIGVLLQDHVNDLSRLEQNSSARPAYQVDVSNLHTEADASDYSAQVVPLLRAQGAEKKGRPEPGD